ncbi:MAG: hypothetical protein FWE40_02535 [Oscillospiraceae bacterium]|nr:hypothetical protein [Oscillospiraceae bacterium]
MIEQVPFGPLMTKETREQLEKLWRKQQLRLIARRLPWSIPLLMVMMAFVIWWGNGLWIIMAITIPLTLLMSFGQGREDHHTSIVVPLHSINNIADVHVVLSASKGYRKLVPAIGNYHAIAAFQGFNEAFTLVCVAVQPIGDQAKIYICAYGLNAWGSRKKITEKYAHRIATEIAAKLT